MSWRDVNRDRSDPPLWLYVAVLAVVGTSCWLLWSWGAPRVLTVPFSALVAALVACTIWEVVRRYLRARRA